MRRLDEVYHRAELRAAAYRGGEVAVDAEEEWRGERWVLLRRDESG